MGFKVVGVGRRGGAEDRWEGVGAGGEGQGSGVSFGALNGGPQCRLAILRNGNVPCRYFLNFPVDYKIVQCRLSILRKDNVPCRYFSNGPVDFKGQWPQLCGRGGGGGWGVILELVSTLPADLSPKI